MSNSSSFIFNWHSISPTNQLRFPDLSRFHGRRVNLRTLSDAALRVLLHVLLGCEEINSEILNNRPHFLLDEALEFLLATKPDNLVYYAEMLRRTDGSENNTIEESSARMNALLERPDLLPVNWEQQRAAFWGAPINPQNRANEEDDLGGSERRDSLAEEMRGLVPQTLGLSRLGGSRASGRESSVSVTTPSATTLQSPTTRGTSQSAPVVRDRFRVDMNGASSGGQQRIRPTRPCSVRRHSFHPPRQVESPTIFGTSRIPQPPPDDRPLEQRGTPYLVQPSPYTQPLASTPRFMPPRVGATTIPGTSSYRMPPSDDHPLEQRGIPNNIRPSPNARPTTNTQGSVSHAVDAAVLAKVRAFGKRAASQSPNRNARPSSRPRANAVNRDLRVKQTEAPDSSQQLQSYRPSRTPRELPHLSPLPNPLNNGQGDVEMGDAEDSVTQDTTNAQQTQSESRVPSEDNEAQSNDPGITEEGKRLSFQKLVGVQAELPPRYGLSTQTAPPVTFPRPEFPPVNRENTTYIERSQKYEDSYPFTPLEHLVPHTIDRPHLLPQPVLGSLPSWLLRPAPNSSEFGVRLVVNRDENNVSQASSHTLENEVTFEMVEDRGVRAPPPTPVERRSEDESLHRREERRTDVSDERPTFQEVEHADSNGESQESQLWRSSSSSPPPPYHNSPYIGRVEIEADDTTSVHTTIQLSEHPFSLLPPPALPLSTESASRRPTRQIRNSPPRPPLTRRNGSRDIRIVTGDLDNEVDTPRPPPPSPADLNLVGSPEHSGSLIAGPPSYQPSSVPTYLLSADASLGLGHHLWTGDRIVPGSTPQDERRGLLDFAVGEVEEGHLDENDQWEGAPLNRQRARTEGDLVSSTNRGRTPNRVRAGNNMVSPYPRQEAERRGGPAPLRRLTSFFQQLVEAAHEGRVRRPASLRERFKRKSRNQEGSAF